MPSKPQAQFTVYIDKEDLEWFEETFPGLTRSWVVQAVFKRFRAKFINQHYPEVIKQSVDEVYDRLSRDL